MGKYSFKSLSYDLKERHKNKPKRETNAQCKENAEITNFLTRKEMFEGSTMSLSPIFLTFLLVRFLSFHPENTHVAGIFRWHYTCSHLQNSFHRSQKPSLNYALETHSTAKLQNSDF